MFEQPVEKLSFETAVKYLSLYLGETEEECRTALETIWARISKRYKLEEASKRMKELVAYTVLYESVRKVRLPEKPINLLYFAQKHEELESREWWPLLAKVIEEDQKIEKIRNFCLNLGVIHPIEYTPSTRQAFNWISSIADESYPGNTKSNIQSLVYAYGGNVLCGVFDKDQERWMVKKLPKWNTVYFFERLLFQVYSAEKIVSIKKLELKKTSPKLIVQLKK